LKSVNRQRKYNALQEKQSILPFAELEAQFTEEQFDYSSLQG